jgi:hypothetical protein
VRLDEGFEREDGGGMQRLGETTWRVTLFVAITVLIVGCSPSQPQKPPTQTAPVSFQSKLAAFLASTNEYEAEVIWNDLDATLDRASAKEIQEWLTLQQTVLVHYTNSYSSDPLRKSAIQEFRLLSDHAEPFRSWLQECKTNGLFADPFVIGNLDLILERMDARKK